MNYNKWFYNQHKYLKNIRDNSEGFNDTKWVTINKRYQILDDMKSELLSQGLLVHGNNTGFDKLIDLMGRSNYTFEDINDSLIDTYRVSLHFAMSRNLVNTHAVMFHCTNMDTKNVTAEKFTHYRIIDAPFNQLHFGHRDEFIRQKLQEMHNISNGNYVDMPRFNSTQFTKILDFSIICTVNGYFCNDCKVAIDDKGFKFKVGWPYASDVDFIVYKLDHGRMISNNISPDYVKKGLIPYDVLGGVGKEMLGLKCIINVFDPLFIKTTSSVPNFGIFTEKGLEIRNLQRATSDMIDRLSSSNVTVDVYALKFFHEIPNLYPAINYYDIMDTRNVYDEKSESIKTTEGHNVVATPSKNINKLEVCTPPICLDRDVSYSFDIITRCLSMYDDMMSYESDLIRVGQELLYGNQDSFMDTFKPILQKIYSGLLSMYKIYEQGSIITSLIEPEQLGLFSDLLSKVHKISNMTDFRHSQNYSFDELYGENYRNTVKTITDPFRNTALLPFACMKSIKNNFFVDNNTTRFNRPISEQCFIALRYHTNDGCWLFDYPDIKHFHGIGNTFYVDSNLKGDEIFKFFVLYSDTEAPDEKDIEHMDLNTVLDFDLFSKEIEKHIGMIRYWDAECRLMKLSKIMYKKYNDETCVQVLSKILKRKISGDNILKLYPSDINYEESNVSSDSWESYDENTERGPFSINFLFYTLSLLNNNEDKLQSYFYRYLTHNKYHNRYTDIDISSIIDNERYPISYSQYTISPSRIPDSCAKPDVKIFAYYGLPLILDSKGSNLYEPYRYVLNVYDPDTKYPMISENDIDGSFYVQYDNITDYAGRVVSYHNNIQIGHLMTLYLTDLYNYISELQTNYKTTFNQSTVIESAINTMNERISTIRTHILDNGLDDIDGVSSFGNAVDIVINDNEFIRKLNEMKSLIDSIDVIRYNNTNSSIRVFINTHVLGTLKRAYVNFGFNNNINKRARMLYIHLKKINEPMNAYTFKKWLTDIDLHTLTNLDSLVSNNENYDIGNNVFKILGNALSAYIDNAVGLLNELDSSIESLSGDFKTDHITPIATLCDDVINKIIFDMYSMNSVEYDASIKYESKPMFVVVAIPDTQHTKPPIGVIISGTRNLIFQPITHKTNNGYMIRSLANTCEYVFFDGTPLTGLTMTILDKDGIVIGTQNVSMTFNRTCSTADRVNEFTMIPNGKTTAIDFENGHESFDVVNGLIVNEKHADMNYEMLIGNHFTQLDHEIEYVLEPTTWLQGSIDRIYIENQMINRMAITDFGHKVCSNVFFKPVQVMHIPLNENGSIDSVNGKYFEGETIYLQTNDGMTIFPVVITKVDHSINKGFIEARVDDWNSKWFEITDPNMISNYLLNEIECSVIDDNMRNFLDEFSDSDMPIYSNPTNQVIDISNIDNCYDLPGDPMFVSSNSNILHRRLKWIFNEVVPNRFIDDDHKKYRFVYIANGFIMNDNDEIKINMINHDFNNTTIPERYPILRSEPNDHTIWDRELNLFRDEQLHSHMRENTYYRNYNNAMYAYSQAKTIHEKEVALLNVDKEKRKMQREQEYQKRMEQYSRQLETPTTWYNVHSYEASLVYISNGRADRFSPSFVSNIRDVVYSNELEVFLYDWQHKKWLDPSSYDVSIKMVDNVRIDENDDYTTNRVLHTLTIKPKEGFSFSNKILIYFSYEKSNVFNSIEMNEPNCFVRFKPLLSIDNEITDYDPYRDIRIRKHFDGYEKYKVDGSDIHIKRVNRNGKYTNTPVFRVCDMKITDINGEHTFDDIDKFLVRTPFKDITTTRTFHTPVYNTKICSEIDSFVPDKEIKLICISNNEINSYDGNISSVMFNATTAYDDEGNQTILITKSTLPNYVSGKFICTVFQDDMYNPVGGVIEVEVSSIEDTVYEGDWLQVPLSYMKYREIPEEFKIIMKNPTEGIVEVTLENKYIKRTDDIIDIDNSNLMNPFEYYYDNKHFTRLPISDVRTNSNNKRFVIDEDINPNVSIVKSPYIGICRYSLNRIPTDGMIDMTGYLPTPLSRDRYEFWVNGRCVINDKDITILSPTSIQLRNMKSLRNFEAIELVDDFNTGNELLDEGTVYVDINGNSYSNYRLAMLSNSKIRNQDIMFTFNTNVHRPIHDYTKNITPSANNHDIEEDILDHVSFDETIKDYNKLYNIPSINGVTLFHTKLQGLGLSEIPNEKIIESFDKIWKIEETTNPLFMRTHRSMINNEKLRICAKQLTEPHWNKLSVTTTGMFLVYTLGPVEKYFSFYISKKPDGLIDDVKNTVKIIPFITSGVYVLIDKKYQGMWLHSTYEKTKPIHLIGNTR